MSLQTIIHETVSTKRLSFAKKILIISGYLLGSAAYSDWSIDLSRRQKDIRRHEMQKVQKKEQVNNFYDVLFFEGKKGQDLVILNTPEGFIPSNIKLHKDIHYRVHVVNINKHNKNVSFVLDAFSQHHGTYFGDITSFDLMPRKEGIYSYQCPETSHEGQLVVIDPVHSRQLASEK